MPLYAVIVFIVEHRQAGLVIELLQTLHSQAAPVLHIQKWEMSSDDSQFRGQGYNGAIGLDQLSLSEHGNMGHVGQRHVCISGEIKRHFYTGFYVLYDRLKIVKCLAVDL